MTVVDANGMIHSTTGKFAGAANTPPAGELGYDREVQAGSFLYPPPVFETAAELVEFFEGQPISDRVLSNAQHAFRHWRERCIVNEKRAEYAAWEATPKARKLAPYQEAYDAEATAVAQAAHNRAAARYPVKQLNPGDVRSILIARQLDSYRHAVREFFSDPSKSDAVMEHQLPTLAGSRSARHLMEHFAVDRWAERALTESDLPGMDASYRLARIFDERNGIYKDEYI